MKEALFEAYFTDGRDPASGEVLVAAAAKANLDPHIAREVRSSGEYVEEVRAEQRFWQSQGITAVPAIVINDRYLISGGQPLEVFEGALREIASNSATAL